MKETIQAVETNEAKKAMSFKPTEHVKKLLKEAQRITGSERTELINASIVEAIERVIENEVKAQAEKAKKAAEALRQYRKGI